MKSLYESYKKTGNLHHAYAIEGDKEEVLSSLYNFFEKDLKIETKANPDFYFNEFESFGIDNGRELRDLSSRKAVAGGLRIFLLTISSITTEAQNSLLKLFEEPTEGVYFFVVVSSVEIFLPTLRSRFNILRQGLVHKEEKTLADNFIKASKSERINMLKDIIENKNKTGALKLLNDLEASLYKNKSKGNLWGSRDADMFETIQKSRNYINGRAPSIKMILENIALSI